MDWLWRAVAWLHERLDLRQKFLLMVMATGLPVAALVGMQVWDLRQAVQLSAVDAERSAWLLRMHGLSHDLGAYRSLAAMAAAGMPVGAERDRAHSAVRNDLATMRTDLDDAMLGAGLDVRLHGLLGRIRQLSGNEPGVHGALLSELLVLSEDLAAESLANGDPPLVIALQNLSGQAARLAERLGALQAMGSVALAGDADGGVHPDSRLAVAVIAGEAERELQRMERMLARTNEVARAAGVGLGFQARWLEQVRGTLLGSVAEHLVGQVPAPFDAAGFHAMVERSLKPLRALDTDVLSSIDSLHGTAVQRAKASFRNSLITCALAVAVLGVLLTSIFMAIRKDIIDLQRVTRAASNGDLSERMEMDAGADELAMIARGVNELMDDVSGLVAEVQVATQGLGATAGGLSQLTEDADRDAAGLQQDCVAVSETLHAVSHAAGQVTATAEDVRTAAQAASEAAEQGNRHTRDTQDVMAQLSEHFRDATEVIKHLAEESDTISRVVVVIRDIAEQTNLLALNAAIEAARAGELGRGFAVVADEVRTLANRTQSSTNDIQAMVESLQARSAAAVQAIDEGRGLVENGHGRASAVQEQLGEVVAAVRDLSARNAEIADLVVGQRDSIQGLDVRMETISSRSGAAFGQVHAAALSAKELKQVADQLEMAGGRFLLAKDVCRVD